MNEYRKRAYAVAPTTVLRPMDVERRYGVTAPTRWRWEKAGTLPPRDVYRDGKPWGWYESTIAASEQRPGSVAASPPVASQG